MSRRRLAAGTGLTIGAAFSLGTAHALTYEVDRLEDTTTTGCTVPDTNDCTLRGALTNSNASTTVDDTITFESGLTGTINLGSALSVGDTVAITGPGAMNPITVNAAAGDTGIRFEEYVYGSTLSGLTLSNGTFTVHVDNYSDVTISQTAISGTSGTGIRSDSYTTLDLNNSTVTGHGKGITAGVDASVNVSGGAISNHSGYNAIGVYADYRSNIDIEYATLSGNGVALSFDRSQVFVGGSAITGGTFAGGFGLNGAAINAYASNVTLQDSTISGHTNNFTLGGGISLNSGIVYVEDSTVANNSGGYGGGIYLYKATAVTHDATFSGNTATGVSGAGGAIYARDLSDAYLYDTTVSNNNAAAGLGGGLRGVLDSDLFLTNVIVANSTGGDLSADGTSAVDSAFSLIEAPGAVPVAGSSNLLGVDPQLGGLAGNGGPTMTHLPAASSPVVDCGSGSSSVDQRGLTRPVDQPGRTNSNLPGADASDIGSVELQAGAGSTGACANATATQPPGGTTTTPPAPPKKKKKCKKKKKGAAAAKKKCKKKKKKK